MEKILKCPKCGSMRIREEENFEMEEVEREVCINEPFVGWCMNCGASLRWNVVWNFAGFDDVEIVEGEEEEF